MCLPYWDSELDVEVGRWGAINLEKNPVSSVGLHSPLMAKIAAGALAMESEFLYLCGLGTGVAGAMVWENPLLEVPMAALSLFTVIFGYSRPMEAFLEGFLDKHPELRGGVTDCTFWRKNVPLSQYKVISLVAALPLIDEQGCLQTLSNAMEIEKERWAIPYYAEKMGYLRAPVSYETDSPRSLTVTAELLTLQLDATWEILGPSPVTALPALYDLSNTLELPE